MIIKSISHEQRRKAAAERAKAKGSGKGPALKRTSAVAQAEHVIAASNYFMLPTKEHVTTLGIEDHLVQRTSEYLVGDKPERGRGERLLHVAHRNFRSETLAEQQAEMIALMCVTPGQDDPFEHMVLSPGHGIVPTRQQMDDVPKRLLELLGTSSHLAFVVWHADTNNIHTHIGVCRVDPTTGERVQLGDGWLLDTLAQARAQIEHEQGWPAEPDARYRANEKGVFLSATDEQVRDAEWNPIDLAAASRVRRTARDKSTELQPEPKLSSAAQEHERRQRTWSDERAAQLIAWPIIRDARSWDELHRGLAQQGMRYDRKGSGARLLIGKRELTATKAHWSASIAKRQPALGRFEPRGDDVEVRGYVPRQLEGGAARAAYKAAKEEAARQREVARNDVAAAAIAGVEGLTREHRRLQQLINNGEWSGRGEDLALARAIAGAVHRDAKADVEQDRRRSERTSRARYKMPRFETWLHDGLDVDEDEAEEPVRKQQPARGLIVGTDGAHRWPNVHLPDYAVEDDALERRYWRGGKLRFVDRGNRIVMADALDRDSVRDALLVAAEKWDSVQITGDRRFRNLAADVAVELGIAVSNPELQARVERAEAKLAVDLARRAAEDRQVRERAEQFMRQWPLVGERDGRMVASAPMIKLHRIDPAAITHPVFQQVLREQLARQKIVFDQLRDDIAREPTRFRAPNGKVTLPSQGGEGELVRRQSWSADPTFMAWLDQAVVKAERRLRAQADAKRDRVEHVRDRQTERARMHGWTGVDMPEGERTALLGRVRARLSADDWDPRDYRRARSRQPTREIGATPSAFIGASGRGHAQTRSMPPNQPSTWPGRR